MFERLTQFFHRKTAPEAPLPPLDARYALGALLVRVAQADNAYLFEEIESIDRILAKAYGLNPIEAAKMRAVCEKLAHGIEDDAHMAALIRDSVDYTHRLEKTQALWEVAHSDGLVVEREAELVKLVEDMLGVARADNEAARAAAVIP